MYSTDRTAIMSRLWPFVLYAYLIENFLLFVIPRFRFNKIVFIYGIYKAYLINKDIRAFVG